jgi:GR25 family glycosyltransferase involved in LPS biosynthesis
MQINGSGETCSGVKPDYGFAGVFCINLDRRTDRWGHAAGEFRRMGLNVERFPAVDGSGLQPEHGLTPGEAGCLASHLAVLGLVLERKLPDALVFEDDVEFGGDAPYVFAHALAAGLVPDDWDLLYLGGAHREPPVPINSKVARVRRTLTASHFAIRQDIARRVIDSAKRDPRPFDVVLADLQPEVGAYTFEPAIAWQRPGHSDIRQKQVDYRRFMAPGRAGPSNP